MIFTELLQYCKVKAIGDSLSPTEESIWRSACRYYSKKFNTPLKEVMKMDPEHVFLFNFEEQLNELDLEENIDSILEQIYRIENPNYEEKKEEEIQEFIKKIENDEKINKSKIDSSKKTLPENEEKSKKEQPMGGFVDFSNLKDEY